MFLNGVIEKEYVSHIYNEILPSLKKKKNNAMCAKWMILESVILSEVWYRETNIIWCHLHMEFKRM